MEQVRVDDKAESSYDLLLSEIRNTGQVFEQRFERLDRKIGLLEHEVDRLSQRLDLFGQRIERKIDQRGDLTDQRLARHLAWLGFWLAGVMIGTAAAMAGLAAAGAF